MSRAPLADRLRPQNFDEMAGQGRLVGEDGLLRRLTRSGNTPNMIFYGPSGVGKTTAARIIAQNAKKKLHILNGTTASTADIRTVVTDIDSIDGRGGIVLYLDEIQYLNKKQQQTLLEFIENGSISLIASTTENPYFTVYGAILSRCTVLEFSPVSPDDVLPMIKRAFNAMEEDLGGEIRREPELDEYIAAACGGDVRKALNAVEAMALSARADRDGFLVTREDAELLSQRSAMRYDRDGDSHYDILSAFQKSIRGSDENAALFYLARLLEAGDIISASRRLLVTACEDIGLAYPAAIPIVKACVDSAFQLGLPEARIPLADAVILLCTAPKSNTGICAVDKAIEDVRHGLGTDVPLHLKDGHYKGAAKLGHALEYKYPHSFGGWVKQQYLPDDIKDRVYYDFGNNRTEQSALNYRRAQREGNRRDNGPK